MRRLWICTAVLAMASVAWGSGDFQRANSEYLQVADHADWTLDWSVGWTVAGWIKVDSLGGGALLGRPWRRRCVPGDTANDRMAYFVGDGSVNFGYGLTVESGYQIAGYCIDTTASGTSAMPLIMLTLAW